jgi:hypothetical protein
MLLHCRIIACAPSWLALGLHTAQLVATTAAAVAADLLLTALSSTLKPAPSLRPVSYVSGVGSEAAARQLQQAPAAQCSSSSSMAAAAGDAGSASPEAGAG